MATLKVDHPEFPAGYGFQIGGIGAVDNGESYEISDEEAQAVEDDNGLSMAQMFEGNPYFVLSGRGAKTKSDTDAEQVALRVGSVEQEDVVYGDPVREEEQAAAQEADAQDTPPAGDEEGEA
jgi:hypothetical protein